MGAAIGCLGGAVFADAAGSVFPGSFNILVSITVLAIIILGGMGSIPGVIVGAFVLIGLPELLREFAEYRLLVYGAVLVAMMLLRPEGLIPNVGRRRELHERGRGAARAGGRHSPVEAGAPDRSATVPSLEEPPPEPAELAPKPPAAAPDPEDGPLIAGAG